MGKTTAYSGRIFVLLRSNLINDCMKLLNLSGAATKIGGLYGVAEALMMDKGYKPDVITGISSGALLSVPLALGKFEELRALITSFKLEDIFDNPPVNKEGKLTVRALARLATGKLGLGTQNNLALTLGKIITEKEYIRYVNGPHPEVYVGAVDYVSGSKIVYRIKDLSYKQYIDAVMASSSIPLYVDPVVSEGRVLYDGGVRDHILSRWALDNLEVSECISVYSRPREYEPKPGYRIKNALDVVKRTVDIMSVELSAGDEREETDYCKANGIARYSYYLPRLMSSQYDTDSGKLREMYEIGRSQVLKPIIKIEDEPIG